MIAARRSRCRRRSSGRAGHLAARRRPRPARRARPPPRPVSPGHTAPGRSASRRGAARPAGVGGLRHEAGVFASELPQASSARAIPTLATSALRISCPPRSAGAGASTPPTVRTAANRNDDAGSRRHYPTRTDGQLRQSRLGQLPPSAAHRRPPPARRSGRRRCGVVAADRHRAQLVRLRQLRHDLRQRVDQLRLDRLRRLRRCRWPPGSRSRSRSSSASAWAASVRDLGQRQLAVEARGAAARAPAPAAAARPRAPRVTALPLQRKRVQGGLVLHLGQRRAVLLIALGAADPSRPPPGRTSPRRCGRAARPARARSSSRCVSCTRDAASSRSAIASSASSSASRAMRPCSARNGFCRFSHSRAELTTASLICTVTMRSPSPRSLPPSPSADLAQPGGQLLDDRLLVAEHLVHAHRRDLVLDGGLGLLLELEVDQAHRVVRRR